MNKRHIRQSATRHGHGPCRGRIGNRRSAFTLIEVLLALIILAIGGVALLKLQLFSMRASDRAARQSQAVLLASQKMSETLATVPVVPGSNGGATDESTPGGPLSWSVMVTDLSGTEIQGAPVMGLNSVKVDVTWPEGDVERKVELTSYVSQKSSNTQVVR